MYILLILVRQSCEILCMVGLEVSIDEMKAVGGSAAGVAVGGVIVPFEV